MPAQTAAKRWAGLHTGPHCQPGLAEPRGPQWALALCLDCGAATARRDDDGLARCRGSRLASASPLACALAAAALGWHVLPLRPGSKRPAFPSHDADHCTGRDDPRCRDGHQEWEQRATTDPTRIRRAWTATPSYGVGIATGPSGLVVIDLDTPKPGQDTPPPEWRGARRGTDVLAALCSQAGQPYPSPAYTVTTGRGGTHLYFAAPADAKLRNTQGTNGGLGWLVDTRAHGGYVVGAGTTVEGRPYMVTCDMAPAPLPAWLANRLRPAPLPPQQPVAVRLATTDRRSVYLRAAITAELRRVTESPPHGHNTALYRSAVALGQLAAGGELDETEVTGWLASAAAQVGQRRGEAARTIRSGLRAGAKRPGRWPHERLVPVRRRACRTAGCGRGKRRCPRRRRSTLAGTSSGHAMTTDHVPRLRVVGPSGAAPDAQLPDHPLRTAWTADELLAASFPEPRWAVPGILAEGVTLFAGPPKVGKSWLSLGTALAVAAGGRVLDAIDVAAGPVLYLALEDTPRRLQTPSAKSSAASPRPPHSP